MTAGTPVLIAVLGPTASGKSDLALSLAERFSGEIVNCDSVQLYRYLDIGSARTPPDQRRGIPHHLFEVLNPDQQFTAGDYARTAAEVVQDISSRNRTPVLAGGTGFYVRALLEGLFEGPRRDPDLRARLERRSSESLHRLLRRFDPAAAGRIHPNDRKKLVRALEVCILSRQPISELFQTRPVFRLEGYRLIKIVLDPERNALAERIDQRCRRMFERGLVEEVQYILDLGYPRESCALGSIGYREAVLYLSGKLSLADAVTHTQAATRQYAKRQRTWFRREQDVLRIHDFGGSASALITAMEHVAAELTTPVNLK